jgi:hypothetical protein
MDREWILPYLAGLVASSVVFLVLRSRSTRSPGPRPPGPQPHLLLDNLVSPRPPLTEPC